MTEQGQKPNFIRLRVIQVVASGVGAIVLAGAAYLMGVLKRPEIATVVLAFAFASAAFSAVFYFGALLFEGSLQKYILKDETVIKGDNVEMVTTTRTSGDPRIDKWIGTYTFTRNLFGLSLVPILILAGLFLFG